MLRRARVVGDSMVPVLREGQGVLVATWAYRLRAPARGEVAVVRHPHAPLRLVKRIAAVPGDEVGSRTLGPDEYWVLGDRAAASTDSRAWGALPRSHLVGPVLASYRPLRRVR